MSNQIPTAFVEGYKSNIIILSQQIGSRMWPAARQERQSSKADFFERIGAVDAQEITTRHGDTPILNTPHSRRMVTLIDAEYGDMIDKVDRVRLLINPDDAYVQAAVNALARKKDDVFIGAALGNSFGGADGSTVIALPNSQKLACFDGTTATGVGLNIQTLIEAKRRFAANEVDERERLYLAYSSKQQSDLLNQPEIQSSDFNSIKALVAGEVDTYMGFKFIRSERLPRSATDITYSITDGSVGAGAGTITAANSRRAFAWAQNGMLSSTGMDITARLAERADKRFGTQVYVMESVGATRLEEEKVLEIDCSEN